MLAAVSLMLPYLFGLGSLLFALFPSLRTGLPEYDGRERLQLLCAALLFGVLVNHALVLSITDLRLSLIVGCTLSLLGLAYPALSGSASFPGGFPPRRWLVALLCLYLACLFVVLAEPVSGWDARSIWFFHAKMIYYNGSVDAGGDWSLPSILFSHPDYPELVPILAAQSAFVAGYWNEYLPKLALAALLFPSLLALASLRAQRWWQAALVTAPLLFTNVWLTNGYMDGYLALYAGLGAFFLGKWLVRRNELDLVCAVLCCGVVLQLKNEGMLYCLIVVALALPLAARDRRGGYGNPGRWLRWMALFLLPASGLLLWRRKKVLFDLHNDLNLGLHSLDKAIERLSDGSLATILKHLYVTDNVNLSLGIFLIALVATLRAGRRPGVDAVFCFCVAACYFCGIVVIYLATPFDLVGFHLPTGNRTMLPVHTLFISAALALSLEEGGRAPRKRTV